MTPFRRIFGRRPVHRTRGALVLALAVIFVAVPGIWLWTSRPAPTPPPPAVAAVTPTPAAPAAASPPSTAGTLPSPTPTSPTPAAPAAASPPSTAGTLPSPTPPSPTPAAAVPPTPAAVSKTEILWEDEGKLLAGSHPLSWRRLTRIKGNRSGRIEIVDEAGVWKISGRQEGAAAETAGDSIAIDGVVLSVTEGTVVMRGEIVFRRANVNGGQACKTSGDLRFYRRRTDPFWRLEGGQNPCNGELEVVDIRLRPEQAPTRPARKPQAKPQAQ
ncbi:MAG: hypothetical protein IPK81_10870 [Rhodospirillales bacterium]|nr:MAG: hypothetical protein IPK81_10870 [Rhodospirillales bacterium]